MTEDRDGITMESISVILWRSYRMTLIRNKRGKMNKINTGSVPKFSKTASQVSKTNMNHSTGRRSEIAPRT